MSWFRRMEAPKVKDGKKTSVPSGMWRKCESCDAVALAEEIAEVLETCPSCGHHFRIGGRDRLLCFLDSGSMSELARELEPADPLGFKDSKRYDERLVATAKLVGENEAFILAEGRLRGRPIIAGSFEFRFMGGSMGQVVGEKVTLAFEQGLERRSPVVIFSSSGGARMQEGIVSLMQMAKTSAAISRFRRSGQPYVSVLTDPTTGGVAASFALLGDIIVAEPGALVGFAGPRVIEQTIRQKLPAGFQRSEFLLTHGVIDQIIPRRELRERVSQLVEMLAS